MAANTFGTLYSFTTYGESHGEKVGVVLDGVLANVLLSEADIQPALDRRRPGQSRLTTQRKESDTCRILSGVFEGKTTGAPIVVEVLNQDSRSKDYSEVADFFRPNHADFSWHMKYAGHIDYRGGGRSSARETIGRVIAGAVALKMWSHLQKKPLSVVGHLYSMGAIFSNPENYDASFIPQNPFFAADKDIVADWETYLLGVRKQKDSVGGIVEVRTNGLEAGLGEPIYQKLDAALAQGLMSINGAKGVEIGDGFDMATHRGTEVADQMHLDSQGRPAFLSNHCGGILGGVSSSSELVVRVAFKPTPSVAAPLKTISRQKPHTEKADFATTGRHDPCIAIRGVVVSEAMVANVLFVLLLQARARAQS